MDVVNVSHKVSCWKSVNEFSKMFKMIFDEKSTIENKKEALSVLKTWKIRKGQDTPLGILCTIVLVDVQVKDWMEEVKDKATLGTLYGSALTKFINYATSFKLGRNTMYTSANQLGIDSFLIDLRHSISHGRQSFNLDVYRNGHAVCMKWIKQFYWDREIDNIEDVDIKDIRYDAVLEEKLDQLFMFYDLLADLLLKNFRSFDELEMLNLEFSERWPLLKDFMETKNLKNFHTAFKHFNHLLSKIITSREMRLNSKTFFHVMLTKSDFLMKGTEVNKGVIIDEEMSDDEEVEITPMKEPKKHNHESVVNLYQNLIWQIAKNDYLQMLIDMLLQIYLNKAETAEKRKTSRFWIEIILKSYQYYQKYCDFTKIDVMYQGKITNDIRSVYSYQLDANLRSIFIFVGTQMLTTSLKYSKEYVLHLIKSVDDEDLGICINFMPLIYPPLTAEQLDSMKKLIDIKMGSTIKGGKLKEDKIYSVEDFQIKPTEIINNQTKIWMISDTEISWSSLPIGYEFRV